MFVFIGKVVVSYVVCGVVSGAAKAVVAKKNERKLSSEVEYYLKMVEEGA